MRTLLLIGLMMLTAGCGAEYASDSDLPVLETAQPAGVCAHCTADSDCGPGAYCAAEGNGPPQFCTAPCDAGGGCAAGQSCFDLGGGMSGCYPTSQTCQVVVTGPTGGGAGGETTSAGSTGSASSSSSSTGTSSSSSGSTGSSSASSSSGTTGTQGSSSSSTSGSSGTSGNTCTPDSWATTMQSFFSQTCNSCHTHNHGLGTLSAVRNEASRIKSEIQTGRMPEGSSLSSAQRSAVITWLNCGAP